jgi:hypothetical protein
MTEPSIVFAADLAALLTWLVVPQILAIVVLNGKAWF